MELRKKNLHMMQKKSEAQNQITFDEDYNVPCLLYTSDAADEL